MDTYLMPAHSSCQGNRLAKQSSTYHLCSFCLERMRHHNTPRIDHTLDVHNPCRPNCMGREVCVLSSAGNPSLFLLYKDAKCSLEPPTSHNCTRIPGIRWMNNHSVQYTLGRKGCSSLGQADPETLLACSPHVYTFLWYCYHWICCSHHTLSCGSWLVVLCRLSILLSPHSKSRPGSVCHFPFWKKDKIISRNNDI